MQIISFMQIIGFLHKKTVKGSILRVVAAHNLTFTVE